MSKVSNSLFYLDIIKIGDKLVKIELFGFQNI